MLSDGCYQGGVYDIAVDPDFQGAGLGKIVMTHLLEDLEGINLILYASPGKEVFYEKFGFRLGKTSMLKFNKADLMKEWGFTK